MNRVRLQLQDVAHREAVIETKIRRDSVELWQGEYCRAVFDREVLQSWLTYPEGILAVDEVTLTLSTSGIVISFGDDGPGRVLEPVLLARLRERLSEW